MKTKKSIHDTHHCNACNKGGFAKAEVTEFIVKGEKATFCKPCIMKAATNSKKS